MNRRRFFSFLGASAAALATVPLIGRLVPKPKEEFTLELKANSITFPPASNVIGYAVINVAAGTTYHIDAGDTWTVTPSKTLEFSQSAVAAPAYREAQHSRKP